MAVSDGVSHDEAVARATDAFATHGRHGDAVRLAKVAVEAIFPLSELRVRSEPRMDLLPDEWEALADLEAAARDVAESVYGAGDFPAAGRRLKYALAELDKVRGRRAPVGGDRTREDERVQEARRADHG